MKDDLISRKQIMDEAKRLSGPMTGDGWDNWGVYALIERQPSVPAVPLDILSKKLASNCTPCSLPFISCPDENHDCKICNGRKAWEKVIKKWMEEQGAAD